MDIRMAAIAVTGTAILILIILKLRQFLTERNKQEKNNREHKNREQKSLTQQQSQKNGQNRENAYQMRTKQMPGSSMEERTMLLTYTTLILKDTKHPVKKYRADLFCPVMIGRSRENTIVLEDSSVSRKHLRIFRVGALVYAENLSRMNGTLLNGKQLTEPREIVTGNRLQIGKQCFLVEID